VDNTYVLYVLHTAYIQRAYSQQTYSTCAGGEKEKRRSKGEKEEGKREGKKEKDGGKGRGEVWADLRVL